MSEYKGALICNRCPYNKSCPITGRQMSLDDRSWVEPVFAFMAKLGLNPSKKEVTELGGIVGFFHTKVCAHGMELVYGKETSDR